MILVTGGTGSVGSELLRLLSQARVATRAMTRNPDRAPRLPGVRAEPHRRMELRRIMWR